MIGSPLIGRGGLFALTTPDPNLPKIYTDTHVHTAVQFGHVPLFVLVLSRVVASCASSRASAVPVYNLTALL